MKVWVTREINPTVTSSIDYERLVCLWQVKPHMSDNGWHMGEIGTQLFSTTAKAFKKFFSFTPRKGTCKQYELSLKEIK